ncbi:MAG: hypothetical protein JWN69_1217 [Alphaproteobacteria bacterium]|nr:hypothetical protein [Alphaproteobacteria bacterium]
MGFRSNDVAPSNGPSNTHGRGSFLRRLARDRAGNTLVIMGMAIIPLAGLIGGAVDVSRLYLTKTRLQQACDAGALAGRKVMGGGTWTANNNAANTAALNFFDANFQNGAYGTNSRTRSFSESGGKVSGTASAVVPMTIMKIFRQAARTLTVTCDAQMQLPNTDVMFVLDNTGSMAQTLSGDTVSKIDGLKKAVKCFYETVAKLDTDADCGSTPSGGTGPGVQIRFGFVPYSTDVNIGKLLPTAYFDPSPYYQSRIANYTTQFYPVASTTPAPFVYEYYRDSSNPQVTPTASQAIGISQDDCTDFINNNSFWGFSATSTAPSGGPPPTATTAPSWPNDGSATSGDEWGWSGAPDTSGTNRSCRRKKVITTTTYASTPHYKFTNYTYDRLQVGVSAFLANNGGNSVTIATDTGGGNGPGGYVSTSGSYSMTALPTAPGATGIATTTASWSGCIEERATVSQASYSPIPAGAKDLDIDSVPSSGDATTQWKPALPDLIHTRQKTSSFSGSYNRNAVTTTANYINDSAFYCPHEGKLLQSWTDPTLFEDYVDALAPTGNTYHDIGLLWGARLISPTGIFASSNAQTPSGGAIERHLIFMTDGETCTGNDNYQAYGIAWFDRRTTDPSVVPTDGCESTTSTGGTLSEQVNARYTALCSAVKNKNITLWVIWYGASFPSVEARLTTCATTGRFFVARNSAQLISTFSSIAAQISQLRLTT